MKQKIKHFLTVEGVLAIVLMLLSLFANDVFTLRIIGFVGWLYLLIIMTALNYLDYKKYK